MKGIVIFFDENCSEYAHKTVFGGKCALDLSKKWAKSLDFDYFFVNCVSLADFLHECNEISRKNNADFVVFSYCDLPFLNVALTKELVKSFCDFKCEYTFADGYPYGFAPEIINCGTLRILEELARNSQKEMGDRPFSRDAVFNLIKTDINAFEVDSVLAPEDWRLLRFAFHCGAKENFLQCENLFRALGENVCNQDEINLCDCDAAELSRLAQISLGCLKTIPAFYNIQICDKDNLDSIYSPYFCEYKKCHDCSPYEAESCMSYGNFCSLLENISDFSDNAVISLSAWGEPLEHREILKMIEKVLSYEKFSLIFETSALNVSTDFCDSLKNILCNIKRKKSVHEWPDFMICVKLDAFSEQTYMKIHHGTVKGDFEKAMAGVGLLCEAVSFENPPLRAAVYPQFIRMNENEDELESFYRFWNDKQNVTRGNFIIQKYENFCNLLPQRKPCDLSPLERNVCWHLRRDMNILSNGDVTFCRQGVFSNIIGNVFSQSLEEIWKKTDEAVLMHKNQNYPKMCEKCDEFYTYNF